jgi:outer membrane receptor protein involved in Fe transport
LYRQFSVGAVVTKANDQLGPERMFGWESGINVEPIRNLTWRNTVFDDRLTHAVSNITIGTNLAQRQNVGKNHIWGIQSDVEYRFITNWRITSAYMYDVARVTAFDINPGIIGNDLPQVPRHRGSVGVEYVNQRYVDIGSQLHYTSAQFDDDVNTPSRRLGGYTTVDFTASRQVREDLDVFFNIQNVFNKEFVIQTNPRTIGQPRLFTAGFRVHI